jgi:lipopolysaccharide transport system permease protein
MNQTIWRELSQIWRYRDFVFDSVKRDFDLRYRRSMLGLAWAVLNPLAMVLVYAFVFGSLMQPRLSGADAPGAYVAYLIAGLLPWSLLAEIATRGQNVFIENAELVKKSSAPRASLALVAALVALCGFVLVLAVFLLLLAAQGRFPGVALLSMIPLVALLMVFAFGLALTLAVANVFFRDVSHLVPVGLQFLFWLTPIVYTADIIPADYRWLLGLNPLTSLLGAFQTIMVEAKAPEWSRLLYPAIMALALNLLGWRLLLSHGDEMVEEI